MSTNTNTNTAYAHADFELQLQFAATSERCLCCRGDHRGDERMVD